MAKGDTQSGLSRGAAPSGGAIVRTVATICGGLGDGESVIVSDGPLGADRQRQARTVFQSLSRSWIPALA
jgi:hypothetical protein